MPRFKTLIGLESLIDVFISVAPLIHLYDNHAQSFGAENILQVSIANQFIAGMLPMGEGGRPAVSR
jgi:hypothetical protein